MLEASRTLGASPWRLIVDVLLPGAFPSILASLRGSAALAWQAFREILWDRYFTAAPRPRTPSEQLSRADEAPVSAIRVIVNNVLTSLDAEFEQLYEGTGRQSIAPERLLRASLLQAFYSCARSASFGIRDLLGHFTPTECANYLGNAGYASINQQSRGQGVPGSTRSHELAGIRQIS